MTTRVVEGERSQRLVEALQIQHATPQKVHRGRIGDLVSGSELNGRRAFLKGAPVGATSPCDRHIPSPEGVIRGRVQCHQTGIDEGAARVSVVSRQNHLVGSESRCRATLCSVDDQRHRSSTIVHDVGIDNHVTIDHVSVAIHIAECV